MPIITFLPDNIIVESDEGSPLLEAARRAGVFVETPCGGKGSCQKCLVKIQEKKQGIMGNEQVTMSNEQVVLICQTVVPKEAITVEILAVNPAEAVPSEGRRIHGAAELLFEDPYKYLPDKRDAFLKKVHLQVAEPALLDGLSDADRFSRAFLKAMQPKFAECQSIDLPLAVLSALPHKLRESNGELLVYFYIEHNIARIVTITAIAQLTTFPLPSSHGIAIDIGTTTVALWLVDLENGKVLATRNAYNSQIECGLDVISRINYAKKYLPELRTKIIKTINDLAAETCAEAGIVPEAIFCVSIAGNTTMIHLLLGITPEYIRLYPYTPAVFQPQIFTAEQLEISACQNAPVLFAPAVGSYVGGDITAGLLCTSLAINREQGTGKPLIVNGDQCTGELVLFIDIGTNGEIVLGNGEFILACACSAGPAFEGGGIKHGVRAQTGAIERVFIGEDGKPDVRTIGGAPPIGICGSGIISAVAELFRKGVIDSAGKFAEKNGEYALCQDSPSHIISICESDIDNFIRAKGAIFSACQTMLDSVGMSFNDVDKVYVAGGFGRYLDLEDAGTIGLLPRMPGNKCTFLGNSSVIGAYLTLLCEGIRTKEYEIAGKITYMDLSSEPKYMDHYTGALFLPHTDRSLFAAY